jgi:serine/threonine protein kinase
MKITPYKLILKERAPGTEYIAVRWIGAGGMGGVWEVVKYPNIKSAMKILHPDLVKRPGYVDRFVQETSMQAALEGHENLVKIKDFGRLADGTPYVVMELLKGKTLRQMMRWRRDEGVGPVPAQVAYEIMRQVCAGLDCLHSQPTPIVHRDLKPENIYLQRRDFGGDPLEPVIKILDFGIARFSDGRSERGLFGTPKYMAPEQLRSEYVTPRADQYAVAVVLYEMLTGRFCYEVQNEKDEGQITQAHLFAQPVPPSSVLPSIPAAVDAVILAALEKDPAKRPRSVMTWLRDLYCLMAVNPQAGPYEVNAENATSPGMWLGDEMANEVSEGPQHDTYRDASATPLPLDGRSLELAADVKPAGKGGTLRMELNPQSPVPSYLLPPGALPQGTSSSAESVTTAEVAAPHVFGAPGASQPPRASQPGAGAPPAGAVVAPVWSPAARPQLAAGHQPSPSRLQHGLQQAMSVASRASDGGVAHSVAEEPIVLPRQRVPRAVVLAAAGVPLALVLVLAAARWHRSPTPAAATHPPPQGSLTVPAPSPPSPTLADPLVAASVTAPVLAPPPVPPSVTAPPPAPASSPAQAQNSVPVPKPPPPAPATSPVVTSPTTSPLATSPARVAPRPKPSARDDGFDLFKDWDPKSK